MYALLLPRLVRTPGTVAYVANNPSAQFIRTGLGALANVGRNTLRTPGTNNFDLAVYKDLNLTERMKFRLVPSLLTS